MRNIEFRTRSTTNGFERDSAIMIDLSATVAVIAMRSGDIASRLLAIRSDVLQFPQRISQRDCSLFGIPGAVGVSALSAVPMFSGIWLQFREPRDGDCA